MLSKEYFIAAGCFIESGANIGNEASTCTSASVRSVRSARDPPWPCLFLRMKMKLRRRRGI